MKIIQVVGARPNFMKVYPIHKVLEKIQGIQSVIVHTGQHSDNNMSDIFFKQLDLPEANYYLGISGGSHISMMAQIMLAFEKILNAEKPDLVIVVGDVNSTLACAMTAAKLQIPLAHVEAGLRSFDKTMPEEINRIITDQLSSFLYTTEPSANVNLKNEFINESKIYFVGNCMIDSLSHFIPLLDPLSVRKSYGIDDSDYAVMTMHRPANVDTEVGLHNIITLCEKVSEKINLIFPVHPRTRNNLVSYGLWDVLNTNDRVKITSPLSYFDFLSLMKESRMILTDSGGIQEESTYLKIPCLTFRNNTERPITIELGTNELVKNFDLNQTECLVKKILNNEWKNSKIPELWDGKAAERIVDSLIKNVLR